MDFQRRRLGQGDIVLGVVTDDARQAVGRPVAIEAGRRRQVGRRVIADAGMIVVKDISAGVGRILLAADARVPRTEITGRVICGNRLLGMVQRFTDSGAILAMCSHDYPFFA